MPLPFNVAYYFIYFSKKIPFIKKDNRKARKFAAQGAEDRKRRASEARDQGDGGERRQRRREN
jgi:hypothetical protein